MEALVPIHFFKHQNGKFAFGSSNIGINSTPMVEVSHEHTPNNEAGSKRVEQAKTAFSSATLGQIELVGSREEGHRHQGNNGFTHGEHATMKLF